MARWPSALEDALTAAVADLPVQLMQFMHARLLAEVTARLDRGEAVSTDDVLALAAEQRAAFEDGHALAAE